MIDKNTEAPMTQNHCYTLPFSEVYNEDCIEVMKRYEDNYFDLAVVDPPYGISYARGKNGYGNTIKNLPTKYDVKWDDATPTDEYFKELFRVSKKQIVWGGNYFDLPPSKCWIVWDKIADMKLQNPFSDCELAWTSFNDVIKKITIRQQGFINDTKDKKRIHPTQKPTELYDFIFKNYAKQSIRCGNKHTKEYDYLCDICKKPFIILDTHLGSGSSRISANKAGLSFVGCEIDKDYFNAQEKRYKEFISQTRLF